MYWQTYRKSEICSFKRKTGVTEGHGEGLNEPAQRQRPAMAGRSAASYQHLFYSARLRKTKGHKVPIHQPERVIIMLMRCILFILPSKWGDRNGQQKNPKLNSVPTCSAMRNQAHTGRSACCISGWCGISVRVITRVCRVKAAACPSPARIN